MNNICSICSLLCDSQHLQQSCVRRSEVLARQSSILNRGDEAHNEVKTGTPIAPWLGADSEYTPLARQILQGSINVHVAGKITSVETAREALALAKKLDASIDGSSSPVADFAGRSLARSGAFLTTLSETRSLADCLIVIGSDRLLKHYPMLPSILDRSECGSVAPSQDPVVVLMGDYSSQSIQSWNRHFKHVLVLPTPLESIPEALLDWHAVIASSDQLTTDSQSDLVHPLLDRMASANYTSVLWSVMDPPSLNMEFWSDRLFVWLDKANQTKRAAVVPLSGLEGTFRQVCTWITGFPTSARFHNGEWEYDGLTGSTKQWLETYSHAPNAVLVVIDESVDGFKFAWSDFKGSSILLSSHLAEPTRSEDGRRVSIPIALAGYDTNATMHRGDGVILAHVKSEVNSGRMPASDWLRKFCE